MNLKPNKAAKWIVGVGGVASFTLFLNAIQQPEEMKTQEPLLENAQTTSIKQTFTTTDLKKLSVEEKQNRGQWISSLDWTDGNWDIDISEQGVYATPVSENTGFAPAKQRTRRS